MDEVAADLWLTTYDEAVALVGSQSRHADVPRAFARRCLAGYLSCDPDEISFSRIESGCRRPRLVKSRVSSPLWVIMSYTEHLIAVGVADSVIGLDLLAPEVARTFDDADLSQYFTPVEILEIQLAEPVERDVTLLRLWAQKRAYLKATGVGIAPAFNTISVSSESDPSVAADAEPPRSRDGNDWCVTSEVVGDCVLALATHTPLRLAVRQLPVEFA